MDGSVLRDMALDTARPWASFEAHSVLASTNERAAALGRPWAVVLTDHQTGGRGRLGRSWDTPAGLALTVSVTLPMPPGPPGWVPLCAGLAVAEAVTETSGLPTGLKWPNDVLLPGDGERKVAGILCEATASGAAPLVVVGAGINLAQTRAALPVASATSLALAGAPVERGRLLIAFLDRLAARYAALVGGDAVAHRAHAAYRDQCVTLGRRVRLTLPAGPDVVGTAVGIDVDGSLLVREDRPGGPVTRSWAAGEVTHLRAVSESGPGLP
jgi:BirA family biotin operon repressor/biotin-[acetyl-CoA-carboxylase] ligase